MKFIHTADLHLASEMESRLTPEKAKQRRAELLATFGRMADYAVENGVAAILLCGDIFDEGKPRIKDKRNFIDVVRAHPQIDFLCLAGNHDESLEGEEGLPENLYCFGQTWRRYGYGEVDVWGIEQSDANYNLIYTTLMPDRAKTNIVMLHGQVQTYGARPARDTVVLPLLVDKGIDYLALGHLHSYRAQALDARGTWCYSGTPEGRGYDECGPKGFVLLEIEDGQVQHSFVRFCAREIVETEVDLSGTGSAYEIEERVRAQTEDIDRKNMVRVYLTGRLPQEAHFSTEDIARELEGEFFAASVKDRTKTEINAAAYMHELSLRGEFVRLVDGAQELTEEEKEKILSCGLKALAGEEVSFR